MSETGSNCQFSGLAKAILKLFEMYFRTEQMSKCVSVAGSQSSHGQRTYKYEMSGGRKEPHGEGWKLEVWYELVISEMYMSIFTCAGIYLHACEYVCIYSLVLSTERAKKESHASNNDHT